MLIAYLLSGTEQNAQALVMLKEDLPKKHLCDEGIYFQTIFLHLVISTELETSHCLRFGEKEQGPAMILTHVAYQKVTRSNKIIHCIQEHQHLLIKQRSAR